MTTEKYRPSLTVPEISYLISILDSESRPEMKSFASELSAKLKVFSFKMNLGLAKPAFSVVSTSRPTVESKLGFEDSTMPAKRKAAYEKYTVNPDFCTAQELRMAQTYRYEQGYMNKKEEEDYENSSTDTGA